MSQPKLVERPASRVVITDEMMLKAYTLANEKDKIEAKASFSNLTAKDQRVNKPFSSDDDSTNETAGTKEQVENCPFDIVCDFLQAVMQKKYKDALAICKTILVYEPDNGIANEFRDVLTEMVDGDDDEEEVYGVGDGDDSDDSADESESSSTDSQSHNSGDKYDELSDEISDSSSASSQVPKPKPVVNDALSRFFDLQERKDSNDSDDRTDSSGSSWSSSNSSHSDSSTESEDASEIADLLMAGAYSNKDNRQDDTFDMISSLDFELDDSYCGGAGSGAVDGLRIEDLGESEETTERED